MFTRRRGRTPGPRRRSRTAGRARSPPAGRRRPSTWRSHPSRRRGRAARAAPPPARARRCRPGRGRRSACAGRRRTSCRSRCRAPCTAPPGGRVPPAHGRLPDRMCVSRPRSLDLWVCTALPLFPALLAHPEVDGLRPATTHLTLSYLAAAHRAPAGEHRARWLQGFP